MPAIATHGVEDRTSANHVSFIALPDATCRFIGGAPACRISPSTPSYHCWARTSLVDRHRVRAEREIRNANHMNTSCPIPKNRCPPANDRQTCSRALSIGDQRQPQGAPKTLIEATSQGRSQHSRRPRGPSDARSLLYASDETAAPSWEEKSASDDCWRIGRTNCRH